MNKTTCLIVLFLIASISVASAEVSKEDPYFGVGSEFLVIGTGNPEIFTLFDNTNIYLDNNNDGIWDYQFQGNGGESQVLNPPWSVNGGARIQADKPVMHKQLIYEYLCNDWPWCKTIYYTTVPPLNNLRSEYYIFSLGDNWNVVAPQDTIINIDINADGTIDKTLNVGRGKVNSSSVPNNQYARIYSESGKKFSLYGRYALAGPIGTDFYTNLGSIKALVTEDNTRVNIDMNNDLAYDETYTLSKGAHDIDAISGAHINSNKPIAVYSKFQNFFPIMTSGMLNNDLWGESGNLYRIIGLFNNASGLFDNTTYNIDFQTQNDLVSNFTGQIPSNVENSLPNMGNVHLWSDMPLNYFYKYSSQYQNYFLPSYSYSRIYPVTFPEEKYIGLEDSLTINARVFNPFAETTATVFSAKLKFNKLFAFPAVFKAEVNKKNLNTDAIIATDTVTKVPVLINGRYEFVISNSDSSLLDSLGPFEYYEIKYNLISPLTYGFYDFEPVEITYTAPTWNMPQ